MIRMISIRIFKNTIQIENKIMIVFDEMIADTLCNKYPIPMATELFIRGRKLNIFRIFIKQFYFSVPNIY